jgi:hypothetical protein
MHVNEAVLGLTLRGRRQLSGRLATADSHDGDQRRQQQSSPTVHASWLPFEAVELGSVCAAEAAASSLGPSPAGPPAAALDRPSSRRPGETRSPPGGRQRRAGRDRGRPPLVLRFRAARGVQRQQLRWVAAGADGAVAALLAVVDQTVSPTQASLWLRPAALLPRR